MANAPATPAPEAKSGDASIGDIFMDIIKSIAPQAFSTSSNTTSVDKTESAKKITETIFERHRAATKAALEAAEAGGDGNAAFQARMGLQSQAGKKEGK